MGPLESLSLPRPALLFIVLAIVAYGIAHARWNMRSRGRPLPPGPKGIPFIGNIATLRQSELWRVCREMCAHYGDLVHLTVIGQHILILGSPTVIFDVLEKRAANTSDRVQSALIELTGQDGNMSLFRYGLWWRRHRRAFWQHFFPNTVHKYYPAQRNATHLFLRKLLQEPEHICEHIRYTFAAAVVKVLYGWDVADKDDKYIALMEKTLECVEAFAPGTYMVEYLPFLRYLPTWVPGAGFQRYFAKLRQAAHEVRDALPAKTREGMAAGLTSQSVVAQLLEDIPQERDSPNREHEEVEIIKNVAFTGYEGGADTTFSTLQTLFLALYLYPEVQKRAQAELDAVVGPDRLPDHNDMANLPYIKAIAMEAMRWRPVLPFALPHSTTEDMEYNGYFIPAGTLILANTWACLQDPSTYPNPERFSPERFLRDGKINPDVCDPARFAFGYGRRICPGRHFADASLFINIAMVLHVFDITPPLDENGDPVVMEPKMTDSLLAYPTECRCTIKPRSKKAEELILSDIEGPHS